MLRIQHACNKTFAKPHEHKGVHNCLLCSGFPRSRCSGGEEKQIKRVAKNKTERVRVHTRGIYISLLRKIIQQSPLVSVQNKGKKLTQVWSFVLCSNVGTRAVEPLCNVGTPSVNPYSEKGKPLSQEQAKTAPPYIKDRMLGPKSWPLCIHCLLLLTADIDIVVGSARIHTANYWCLEGRSQVNYHPFSKQ